MDFNFEDEEEPQDQRKGPKKRFRKNKLKLVFDSDERRKFLQGFRKRKQERKEKYVEKLERDLAKEKKRIRQQTQRATKKLSSSHSILPEVQSLIENMPEKTETYDLGNTLVSITSLDDKVHRNLPAIKEESDEDDSEPDYRSSKKVSKTKSRLNFGIESDDDDMDESIKTDPFFNPINDEELSRSDVSEEDDVPQHYNPLLMLRQQAESESTESTDKPVSKAKIEREANRMLQQSDIFKKMQRLKQKKSKKFRLFRLPPSEQPDSKEKASDSGKKAGRKKNKLQNCKGKHGGKRGKTKR